MRKFIARHSWQEITAIVVIPFLAACAPMYVPERSDQMASVRFVVQHRNGFGPGPSFVVAALADEQCSSQPPAGVIAFFTRYEKDAAKHQVLGMPGADYIVIGDKDETLVPAGHPFSFSFKGNLSFYPVQSTCTVSLSFVPAPEAMYEVEYHVERYFQCSVTVSRLESTPDQVLRIPDQTVRSLPCKYPEVF